MNENATDIFENIIWVGNQSYGKRGNSCFPVERRMLNKYIVKNVDTQRNKTNNALPNYRQIRVRRLIYRSPITPEREGFQFSEIQSSHKRFRIRKFRIHIVVGFTGFMHVQQKKIRQKKYFCSIVLTYSLKTLNKCLTNLNTDFLWPYPKGTPKLKFTSLKLS